MNLSLFLRGSLLATVLAATAFTGANAQAPAQAENAVSRPPKVEDSIVSTRARDAQRVKFITSRQALGADDTVDWSTLGAPFTAVPLKASVTSPKGFGLTIDIMAVTATPPIVFPTGPEPSIATAFARGDFILFTGGENPQFPGLENPSPITITFAKPVFGAGANLQPDDECTTTCPYTGIIQAFDKNNRLIGTFKAPGISSRNLDDSAPFYGIRSNRANISKIVFSIDPAVSGPHPISINALSLVTTKTAGAVYAMTNEVSGNKIVSFSRKTDGTLTPLGNFPTDGKGIGDEADAEGLGSQGALSLSENKRWLYAVNAGSNDISIFAVKPEGLTLVGKTPSGGNTPISLTIHRNLLYVLNYNRIAADCGNITGFRILGDGKLSPLEGSTRPLSKCGANPGQVAFNPRGNLLAVTEKGTNLIGTYTVDPKGLASAPIANPSFAENPFSLVFGERGVLLVSDGFGDRPGEGAASSYLVSPTGKVDLVSKPVGNGGAATCWVVLDSEGKQAYVTNTNSGTVSTYNIARDGKISLANATSAAIGEGTKPRDLVVVTDDNEYVYVLNSAVGTVSSFKVNEDDSFTLLGTSSGIPAPGSGGIAAF
jgi:6-phosphogluconolactonase